MTHDNFISKRIEECEPGDRLDMGVFAGIDPRAEGQGPNTVNVRLANGLHYTETVGALVQVWIPVCDECGMPHTAEHECEPLQGYADALRRCTGSVSVTVCDGDAVAVSSADDDGERWCVDCHDSYNIASGCVCGRRDDHTPGKTVR